MRRTVEDYVLFDCPGQVELFTHHSSLRNIFLRIQKLGYRVCFHSFPPPFSSFILSCSCHWEAHEANIDLRLS